MKISPIFVLVIAFALFVCVSGIVSAIDIPRDKTCYTDSGVCFDKETNIKRTVHNGVSISSPQEIVCVWSDPDSNWKNCEVVIEIENQRNTAFLLPINSLKHRFRYSVKEMVVSYSKDYTDYTEKILNISCYEDLSEEVNRSERVGWKNKTN